MMAAPDERDRRHLTPIEGGAGDTVAEGDGWPALVQPGLYRLVFLRARKCTPWRTPKWEMFYRVIEEGPAHGLELPMYATRVTSADRLHPGRKLVHLFAVGTDRKPPRNLWQYNPRQFLEGCEFEGKVVTVTRDGAHNVERPPALHTSVIATLTRRITGSPPILTTRPPQKP